MTSLRSGKGVCVGFLMYALLCTAAAISARAQTFTSLFSFTKLDGAEPRAALVQGLDGAYYGTTFAGGDPGDSTPCTDRCGVVFKVTADGAVNLIHKFCSMTGCVDGSLPEAGLVVDSNDNFYGTTASGGAANSNCAGSGCGTIFQMSPTGTLTTVHSFGFTDGYIPISPLIQGTDGDLYGLTEGGGAFNQGSIFKMTTQGVVTTLHSFCNPSDCTDFSFPFSPLVLATDGNFYGTTEEVIYKMNSAGVFSVLYTFPSRAVPSNLIQGPNGKFYGTSSGDGTNGQGTFFEFTPGSAPTVLYNFKGPEGTGDAAWLSLGSDGNFYGTSTGGSNSCPDTCGTVFQITPAGVLTTLHNFDGTDGMAPNAALLQGTDGSFYGTTSLGGSNDLHCFQFNDGCGTVFSLSMNLQPFVKTVPTAGPVGRNMYILGTDLTGTTKVTFNGVSASFTVLSPTEIRTQVPAGATTGPVQVVTSSATLTSNVVFGVF